MKKAIVIGASSGIGKRLAQLLVDNNYTVGITGRRKERLWQLKEENPTSYIVKSFDVIDTPTAIKKLEELKSDLGRVDLLIISSGVGFLNNELDFEIDKVTIDTNVLGFTAVADWAFNLFKQQGHGHLVALTSIAGIRGLHPAASYSASKAYQISYLEALRQKAHKSKLPIFVTDIRPGFVDTDLINKEQWFWVCTVEKASKQILKAIKAKKSVAYVTKRWKIVGVALRRLPRKMLEMV